MSKKIKILHLIKSLGRGGAEKLIPETALVHDQQQFEFYCIYFYHQENNIVDELEDAGIQVNLIPSNNFGIFFQVNKVREFILENDIDLIHAHLPWAGILARTVGSRIPIPIVYTEHNTWDRYNKVSYWGNRISFRKQDVAIAVSNEVALSMRLNSIWSPYKRGERMKLKVIQNGVNTEEFVREGVGGGKTGDIPIVIGRRKIEDGRSKPEDQGQKLEVGSRKWEVGGGKLDLRVELGIPSDAPVLGKVAVFRSQKRLWLWVDIALAILAECPEAHFLLVGDGEWRDRILAQIEKSGKAANFHWVGVQKKVIPYLSIMDIYLSSSEFEGLPIAMLEAMSCEVAVVGTRAGGIGEVIQHGVQGYLTEIDQWQDLVPLCISLIRDPEKLALMKKAARDRVVADFSMVKMVKELEEVYYEVLGTRG